MEQTNNVLIFSQRQCETICCFEKEGRDDLDFKSGLKTDFFQIVLQEVTFSPFSMYMSVYNVIMLLIF